MMFALMVPVIVTGAWAEKMTVKAFFIFVKTLAACSPTCLLYACDADLGTCSAAASGASKTACAGTCVQNKQAYKQAHDLRHARLHARTRKFTPHTRGQHHYTLIKTDLHTRTCTRTHTHQQLLSSPPPKGLLYC